jgi:hypothetical protein
MSASLPWCSLAGNGASPPLTTGVRLGILTAAVVIAEASRFSFVAQEIQQATCFDEPFTRLQAPDLLTKWSKWGKAIYNGQPFEFQPGNGETQYYSSLSACDPAWAALGVPCEKVRPPRALIAVIKRRQLQGQISKRPVAVPPNPRLTNSCGVRARALAYRPSWE